MNTNEMISTRSVLSRAWKVTIDIQIPSMVLTIDRQRDGIRKKTETMEVMSDKVFLRRRQAVRKILVLNGTAFDGGYLIPDSRIEGVITEITAIGREFLAAIPGFFHEWPAAVDVLCSENAADAEKIRRADAKAGGVAGLAKGLQFRLSKYRVNPDEDIPLDLSGIDAEVRGLAGQIAHEVSQSAKHEAPAMNGNLSAWRSWFAKIASKIEALAFINPNLESLTAIIKEQVLPNLVDNGKGKIDETTGFIIGGVMSVLSNPQKMLSVGAPMEIERRIRSAVQDKSKADQLSDTENYSIEISNQDLDAMFGVSAAPAVIASSEVFAGGMDVAPSEIAEAPASAIEVATFESDLNW